MESSGTSASGPDFIPSRLATELVSDSFATVRHNFWGFVRIGFILAVLSFAASLIPVVGELVMGAVVAAAGVVAAVMAFSHGTVPAIRSVASGFKLVLPVLGAQLLYTLAIVLLAITIIGIPYAIHLSVRWSFVVPAIVLERLSIRPSFSRSTELVRGQWWRIVGCALLMGLALIGFFIVVFGVWFVVVAFIPPIGILLLLVLIPLSLAFLNVGYVFTTLLYVDSRTRKEAYSRDQLHTEIAAYA